MRILITGGGTGGHVFPAIAIADALKKNAPDTEFLFVGANGRMEMEKVPQAGYPIKGLTVAGLQRKFTLKNLALLYKIPKSMWQANRIVNTFKPQAVVGVGGYASLPVLRVAQSKGIPTIIQEQNSFPGMVNKWCGGRASAICVAYENMDRWFEASKIHLTGNPLRAQFSAAEMPCATVAKSALGFKEDQPLVLVMGGSLGAASLNQAMQQATPLLEVHSKVQWLWQCGKRYAAESTTSATSQLGQVQVSAFIDRMDLAYAAADLIIARAGALTVSELALLGKPMILVPSPNVAEDHQTKNALALVNAEAAKMIADREANTMVQEALDLLAKPEALKQLATNSLAMGKPNAADDIAQLILKLARPAA